MTTDTLCEQTSPSETVECRPDPKKLWRRYARGGPGSKTENELVEQYLPLVKTIVGRLAMTLPTHVDRNDLYSAGLIGLLNAIRRFDPKCGASFETYARLRIRGAVLDEMRRCDWVPRSVHTKARKVQDTMWQLEQKLGRPATEAEMARAMRISVEDYLELLSEIQPTTFVCLDSVRSKENEERSAQHEAVCDDRQKDPSDTAARHELAELIAARLHQLPEAQRKVLAFYYFEDMRLWEIAEAFGVTESRICQIHAQAIQSIRTYLRRVDPLAAQPAARA